MWMFYAFGLPLTLGMVVTTLKYFAGPDVSRYVHTAVGYTWFCSLSIIVLVPADIWTTLSNGSNSGINLLWSWSYWSTFCLTWLIVPLLQGYEDAGDFTFTQRLKTSVHVNLVFYLSVGSVGLLGIAILLALHKLQWNRVMGLAIACSNTFGLVTGAFLLGFGLLEIPRSLWRNADWTYRHKRLSHKVAKVAVSLDDAHQELSTAIVIAQATSNQMSRRDPLRPCMDVIDKMLLQMAEEDPSFKPSGGRMGESDMDYDADEKSMAALRRRLQKARYFYGRFKSEYISRVQEALGLEDTIKNFDNGKSQNWRYVSSLHRVQPGPLSSYVEIGEWFWRCYFKPLFQRALALTLGLMSFALLFAEATLLPNKVDLSLFSLLIKALGQQEILVQTVAFIPLVYMCACTYFSLFKLGMFTFYYLTPKYTSSVSLLMICSMVARYAPPIAYNFLNLLRLGDGNLETTFEKRMGKMDEAAPFFNDSFNRIYPLFMVVYTILIASNFFDRMINFFGSWHKFLFKLETEDADGFDTSGLIILHKERGWIEQGHSIGENVVPLARNFANLSGDVEAEAMLMKTADVKLKNDLQSQYGNAQSNERDPLASNALKTRQSDEYRSSYASRSSTAAKYISGKSKALLPSPDTSKSIHDTSSLSTVQEKNILSANSQSNTTVGPFSSGLRWNALKSGFQDLKLNLAGKRFAPLRQTDETGPHTSRTLTSPSDTLESIFENLKRKPGLSGLKES
ncbi:hypothetical protein KP509_08G016900 [Ceratopteris richardii]|uniref:LMBR1-like membrane protein n=1 Tax=Ceratopteris richardii TaxID=49495 RepID=A0A8T2U504_CERRI|nr:hypothetical protein KP509_08G016900 [Ceratopteris richardii]KAH7430834.1 hypothetical protein KP509_08G016900 [Ceratopteris richardii]KAH7430835.1 hypothetical protein KP509_08G016900 [Ceratopteris richardii]KAH7430837.1 hypothetical protein KP509_08G016900 [Ceratopteris richardii]